MIIKDVRFIVSKSGAMRVHLYGLTTYCVSFILILRVFGQTGDGPQDS